MSEQPEVATAPAFGTPSGTGPRPRGSALAEGTVLGERYVLADRLGQGGMAEVYRARDSVLGREVAVKVFHPTAAGYADDPRHGAEMRLLARLNHPGLVMMLDAGTTELPDGELQDFLVMELVRGPSLAARIAQGPMPVEEAALVGVHVAEALAYIHDEGVVHRDVKPANILLPSEDLAGSTAPWVKLTDFGIARARSDESLTTTGELLGTPPYLSPEQATGGRLTSESDVYALGLVLVECLTGERAFPGDALTSAVARLHQPVPVPERFGARWAELIGAMTALDPLDRLTATTAAEELRALLRPAAVGVGPVAGDIGSVTTEPFPVIDLPPLTVPAVTGSSGELPATRRQLRTDHRDQGRARGRRGARTLAVAAVAVVAAGSVLLGVNALSAEPPQAGPPERTDPAGGTPTTSVATEAVEPSFADVQPVVEQPAAGQVPAGQAPAEPAPVVAEEPVVERPAGQDEPDEDEPDEDEGAGPSEHANERAKANAEERAERKGRSED